MTDANRRTCSWADAAAVCISGMHRSGTSLVARLLRECGLYLGADSELIGPEVDNADGFWEHLQIVRLNDDLLGRFGGAWDLPPVLPSGWEAAPEIRLLREQAASAIESLQGHGLWGWKDPRNSLTMPFWRALLPRVKVVLCLRSPLEVAASLQKRGYSSRTFSLNLWYAYNKSLVDSIPPERRVVTRYDSYFADPQKETRRLLDFVGLPASEDTLARACSQVKASLRHHPMQPDERLRDELPPAVRTLYAALCEEAGLADRPLTRAAAAARGVEARDHSALCCRDDTGPVGHEVGETRLIAFYLPQFHPIPENDQWWGEGFTDWTNVKKAEARFAGHYQPHVPADLGYYDLRSADTRQAQAELARKHGIFGFCYYHYWFNGKRLLHQPLDEVLASGTPDFPFCLCWANEDWTRAWDGRSGDTLIEQRYSDEDDREHIRFLATVFRDRRYVRIDGRPVFLVYRANRMPDPRRSTALWREEARRLGIGDVYLCRVESFADERGDPALLGFDAAVEFQPDWASLGPKLPGELYGGAAVYRYDDVAGRMMRKARPPYRRFPCVTPSWDNSPRRKEDARIITGSTPARYERWLRHAIAGVREYGPDEKIVFINGWNEWGEGNHLEPDERFGTSYLEATRRALDDAESSPEDGPLHETAVEPVEVGSSTTSRGSTVRWSRGPGGRAEPGFARHGASYDPSMALQVPVPPPEISDVGDGDFYAVGREYEGHLIVQGGLRPDDRVLEPGCGIGRMASGLVHYLKPGAYEGFDIVRPAIDWCRREITSRFPNFRFTHADVRNTRYNKAGTIEAKDFGFPYESGSFDFALLTSVFTHLLPEEVDHYLGEIARVLKPGRRCLITWLLLDEEARRLIAAGKSHRQVPIDRGGYRLACEDIPEALVAYDQSLALSLYAKHGLEIVSLWPGEWCGKPRTLSWQDLIVAMKRSD